MTQFDGPVNDAAVSQVVRTAVGREDAEIGDWYVEPVNYHSLTPSTISLSRVRGTTTWGESWSLFVKSIGSARYWPLISEVPEQMREEFIATFPWRAELDAHTCGLPLPDGLRLPRLFRVDDLGDERVVLWMEDVRVAPQGWALPRYRTAARLLGRLAAMRQVTESSPAYQASAGPGLRPYCAGRVEHGLLPILRNPATWEHPLVARHADPGLREDLLALAERIPALLDALDLLPQTLVHGDACPQNLLIPADGSAEFVAIDWSWPGAYPIGFDLAQLLVGLAQAGETEPDDLPAIHAAIVAAYAEGFGGDPGQVAFGHAATVVLRCGFSALPGELLEHEPTPALDELFRKRMKLARFIADLGLRCGQGSARSLSGNDRPIATSK
ncbi:MAG: Phosphotransferase enzyme family protein [Sphaerisporangium sp.]|nr:Phosphotransferase enzyme family protein [Sphaerisporangium sp.]